MRYAYLQDMGLIGAQLEAFALYQTMLLEGNAKVNLTSITAPEEVEIKHFVDSLLLMRCPIWQESIRSAPEQSSLRAADVGSGAGFPGIPLQIAMGGKLCLDLLEATGKRVVFLRTLIEALGLPDTKALHIRAEDAGRDAAYRARYDWVFARGVAAMPALLEYCLPLLRIGGHFAAYKGPAGSEEAKGAVYAAATLGGKLVDSIEAPLPEGQGQRCILVYEKVASTPRAYPRKAGIPAKQPLQK